MPLIILCYNIFLIESHVSCQNSFFVRSLDDDSFLIGRCNYCQERVTLEFSHGLVFDQHAT